MTLFLEKLSLALAAGFSLSAADCPGPRDAEFLRGLNAERQYAVAIYQAELFRARAEACPASPELDLEMGKALYQSGEFARTRAVLAPHLGSPDPLYRRYFTESWLLDFALPRSADSCLAFLKDTASGVMPAGERAAFTAAALFIGGRSTEALAAWPRDFEGAGNPAGYLEKGFKQPWTAAGLSLAPGLGYVYAGQAGDGLFSLALIGAFYGVAAYYAAYDSPARAWTFASLGAVFHVSGSYGAHRAARETNRRRKVSFLVDLHRRMFP